MAVIRNVALGALVLEVSALAGCGTERGTDEAAKFSLTTPVSAEERVTFARLRAEVLKPFCIDCHESLGTEAGFAETIEAGRPESSKALIEVESGSMPMGGPRISENTITLMRKYIEGLAPTE